MTKDLKDKDYNKEESKTKKFLDAKGWAVLGLLVMQVGSWAVNAFTDTVAVGAETKMNNAIDSRIETAMNDANMLSKAFSSDKLLYEINKQVKIAKQEVKNEVYAADSSKIDFIGALGVGATLRDEEIMPMFVQLLISIDNGELLFKKDIEDLIEKEVEKRISRTVRASF